jgi:hypothetical protein
MTYESYTSGDTNGYVVENSSGPCGQSFTPQITHTITAIKFKAWRLGTNLGTITVSVFATSSSLPTGNALCSGTLDTSSITQTDPGEWVMVSLGSGATLTKDVEYCFTITSGLAAPNNVLIVRYTYVGNAYSRGSLLIASDGSTWEKIVASDFLFEDIGPDGGLFFCLG